MPPTSGAQGVITAAIGGTQQAGLNTFSIYLTKPQAQTLDKVLQLTSEVVV